MKVTPTDYLGAVLPLPARVLGNKLQPFALGHRLILERLGSPFVSDGPVEISDLIVGIIVCSRSPQAAWRALDSWCSVFHARTLGWRARLSGADYLSCVAAFRAYVEAGSKMPSFWQKDNRKRLAVPLTMLVKVYLQKELGYSHDGAIERPWGAALHEYCVALSIAGQLDLIDADEAEFVNTIQPPTEDEMAALRKVANGV